MMNAPAHRGYMHFKMFRKMGNMKDKCSMATSTVKVFFTLRKEVFMKDNGIMIKCMDMGSFFIPVENWPMKEDGSLINFQEWEKFTTMNRISLINRSTLLISTNWERSGFITREIYSKIKGKERENWF